jgi:hypothetical protein
VRKGTPDPRYRNGEGWTLRTARAASEPNHNIETVFQ